MQVEYPFLRYNLFAYVYVLSFYERAKHDARYLEALKAFESKLDERGRVVVERPHRDLATLSFCVKDVRRAWPQRATEKFWKT